MLITQRRKLEKLKQHQAKQAGQEATDSTSVSRAVSKASSNSADLVFAQMEKYQAQLKELKDVTEKVAFKKQVISEFTPWIQKYMESGEVIQDPRLSLLVLWLLDADDFELGLALADVAIKQEQPMPEKFSRDLATVVVETVAEWAHSEFEQGHSAEPYLGLVAGNVLAGDWPVDNMIVLTKIYKIAGQSADKAGELEAALKWYEMCRRVNPVGHGVKTKLQAVCKKLGRDFKEELEIDS